MIRYFLMFFPTSPIRQITCNDHHSPRLRAGAAQRLPRSRYGRRRSGRPPDGPPLANLTGPALAAATSLLTSGSTPATTIQPSTAGVLWLDLPCRTGLTPSPTGCSTVTVRVPPGLPVPRRSRTLARRPTSTGVLQSPSAHP